jgi:hypothetical protein
MEWEPPVRKNADGTNRFPANNFPTLVWDSHFLMLPITLSVSMVMAKPFIFRDGRGEPL